MFDLTQLRLPHATPRMLSDVSAWIQHIPFAFAIVEILQPRTLVELGSHKGDSYCAFCQAIDTLGLGTKATAVDTWAGDHQAGEYGDAVLAALREHHDPLYARFSTLQRATFDEASRTVADGTVDLLHIDGLHTYEAVSHDFETWLPKMSERGVVLFHDTNVRTGDFGVYRLWEEVAARYRGFAFLHGFGLGVLAVGEMPEGFARFMELAASEPERVRSHFAALGQRLELARAVALQARGVRGLQETINSWRAGTQQVPRETLAVAGDLPALIEMASPDLKWTLDAVHLAMLHLQEDAAAMAQDGGALRSQLAALRSLHEQTMAELHPVKHQVGHLQGVVKQLEAQVLALDAEKNAELSRRTQAEEQLKQTRERLAQLEAAHRELQATLPVRVGKKLGVIPRGDNA